MERGTIQTIKEKFFYKLRISIEVGCRYDFKTVKTQSNSDFICLSSVYNSSEKTYHYRVGIFISQYYKFDFLINCQTRI